MHPPSIFDLAMHLNWQPPNALIRIRAFCWQDQNQGLCGSSAIYHHQLADAPHGIDLAVHPVTGSGSPRMMPWMMMHAHAVSSSVYTTCISAAYFWAGDWNVAWCSLTGICCHGYWYKLFTAQQQLPSMASKSYRLLQNGVSNRWCICL